MLRQNSLSKSTKRRRILNEINLIKHSLADDSSPQLPNIVTFSSEISYSPNDITCQQDTADTVNNLQFEPSSSCSNKSFDRGANNISAFIRSENADTSNSDLDHPSSLKQSINENLYQWASENNVPNSTFDKLLKILKGHKCFQDLPITSRTFYKMYNSSVSYNKPVEMKSVSPGQDLQKMILLGRQFEKMSSFFSKPLKSEKLGIYKVEKFSKQIKIWNIEDVVTKYMILTINDLNVAYPIIHFNNNY
ncbi:hypothetical protein ACI65C_013520 [Semiaphis heraclei]